MPAPSSTTRSPSTFPNSCSTCIAVSNPQHRQLTEGFPAQPVFNPCLLCYHCNTSTVTQHTRAQSGKTYSSTLSISSSAMSMPHLRPLLLVNDAGLGVQHHGLYGGLQSIELRTTLLQGKGASFLLRKCLLPFTRHWACSRRPPMSAPSNTASAHPAPLRLLEPWRPSQPGTAAWCKVITQAVPKIQYANCTFCVCAMRSNCRSPLNSGAAAPLDSAGRLPPAADLAYRLPSSGSEASFHVCKQGAGCTVADHGKAVSACPSLPRGRQSSEQHLQAGVLPFQTTRHRPSHCRGSRRASPRNHDCAGLGGPRAQVPLEPLWRANTDSKAI
jgi:hypothetical protein